MNNSEIEDVLRELPPSSKFIYNTLLRMGSMTLKGLTEETLLSSRTTRYGLTQLEEAGLVESSPALHDGRQSCYSIAYGAVGGDRTEFARGALVDPEWVRQRLDAFEADDPELRLVEVTDSYDEGHIRGAVHLDPDEDFLDVDTASIPGTETFESVLGNLGITPDSTVVLYSDGVNEYAALVYWTLKYYRHMDVRLLDGGKSYWVDAGFPTTHDVPVVSETTYTAQNPHERIRAYRRDVQAALSRDVTIVDVRSPEEYRGETAGGADARVAGRVPNTVNVEWTQMVGDAGRFKGRGALEQEFAQMDLDEDDEVIVYCNVGERSALVWFVLSELLGYQAVSNYDGSWTEWGNMVGAPIRTGDPSESE
ncbi:rhodanese-like domain-containing protein [Haloferax profundi]|uniref:Sulfurtransferase n=1 Tax=Haloferax profundi TaxID=1544718 RepID=A0A0W1SSB0_9EURY|nr:rhodanese-like domain-containing protein [Haloferax profundi]KTG29004.1 MarR family transcriptional regulator [Haloferax profundi]